MLEEVVDTFIIAPVLILGGVAALGVMCYSFKRIHDKWWESFQEKTIDYPSSNTSLLNKQFELPPIIVPDGIVDPKDIAKFTWKQIGIFAEQGNLAAKAIIEKPETRLTLSFKNKKTD